MSLISLHSIRIAFGGAMVLDDVSLDIHKGQRICFSGRNGAGKSTLMKIIAGELEADGGDIIPSPGLRIAYLPQEVPDGLQGTVFEIVAAGAGETGSMLKRYHHLVNRHAAPEDLYDIEHYLNEHNGWHFGTAVTRAIQQVGLDATQSFAALSGGMRRRALLARALAREPGLLLLDEPTNHLDIDSITWLEKFLCGAKVTVAFVSHDRRLIKRLSTRIVELDRGKLTDWNCDFATFLERKQAMLDSEEKEWGRFDKKMAQEEMWIRRGIKARRTRNEGRVRALMRMRDERRKRRERSGTVNFSLNTAERSGERVIDVKNVSFSYHAQPVIHEFSAGVTNGDRIGILGPNGCGKTTLLNLLLGKIQPLQGTITFGTNIAPVYFDQLRGVLDPEKTVWENVLPGGGDSVFVNGKPQHIVSYLQDFLFTPERIRSPVKQLSGGERNRCALARMFTQPANVLVFDEPTNDLDTETLELLEEALMEYNGTILVVSHDREFLNNVVTSTLVFEGNGVIKEYIGGYDDWEQLTRHKEMQTVKETAPVPERQIKEKNRKPSYKERQELEMLPKIIERLEAELDDLHARMADPENYKSKEFARETRTKSSQLEHELAIAYQRWEELEAKNA